jgi:hypothetical protein
MSLILEGDDAKRLDEYMKNPACTKKGDRKSVV